MNFYKKCNAKPYFFLVNDTTLASDNPLYCGKNIESNHEKYQHYRLEK